MNAYARRKAAEARAAMPVYDSPTDRAAADHARSWRPDVRIARGSSHTRTKKAHLFCAGDGQCGTKSAHHCGGRRFAALTSISFSKDDNSLRIALGMKRQARINKRGW
jgi:hypothetical protein